MPTQNGNSKIYKDIHERIEVLLLIERDAGMTNMCVMQLKKLNKNRSRKRFKVE